MWGRGQCQARLFSDQRNIADEFLVDKFEMDKASEFNQFQYRQGRRRKVGRPLIDALISLL
jgi:hypothetical protein